MSSSNREYQTAYARRKRKERWAAKAVHATHCPAMLANGHRCGWRLANRFIGGRTVPVCAQCDRKAAGICIDCRRAPVEGTIGKALRCSGCKKLERTSAGVRYKKRHPGRVKKFWRRRKAKLLKNPELRQRELERKKAWRLAHPKRKAKWAREWQQSATAKAYHERYRDQHRDRIRAAARAYYNARAAGQRITHPCVTGCGEMLTGRQKKCTACRDHALRSARSLLIGAAA